MTLTRALRDQAAACAALGSPFTARLLRGLARELRPGTPLSDRLFGWPGDLGSAGASVPLRLAGALHALVLTGRDAELAGRYPPHASDDATLVAAARAALDRHAAFVDAWLDRPPQTNEVGRGAVLIAAGHWLAKRSGLPLVLSELGASAGLNLMWDRFALSPNGWRRGAADPALTLMPAWTGPPPPAARPRVTARRGVDLTPLDPRDPDHALRLQSYVWPDQRGRLARLRAAIAVSDARVDAGDAATWLEERLETPQPDVLHLVYHTVAWQYFPPATRDRARAALAAAGARATRTAPLARLSMEADGAERGAALTLWIWPPGQRIPLGRADFHGRWVDWDAPGPS